MIQEKTIEIKEIETSLLEKKNELKKTIADLNLRDSNISFKVTELELLYEERKYEDFRKKLKFLNDYINVYEVEQDFIECDPVVAVNNFCSLEEIPFPKNWNIRATMQPSLYSVIAGGTGTGKTRLLSDLCSECFLNKKNVIIYSIEVDAGSLFLKIAIQIIFKQTKVKIGYKFAKQLWKDKPNNNEYKLLKSVIDVIRKYVTVVKMKNYTSQQIYSSVNFKKMSGVNFDFLAVDYFQIMKPNDPHNMRLPQSERNDLIADATDGMIALQLHWSATLQPVPGGRCCDFSWRPDAAHRFRNMMIKELKPEF